MLENIDICKIPLMMERRTESRGFFMKKEKNASCIIKDWRAKKNIAFQDLIRGEK